MTAQADAFTGEKYIEYIRIVATAGSSGALVEFTNTAGDKVAKSVLTSNAPFIDHIPIQQWVDGLILSDLDPTATIYIYLNVEGGR